MNEGIFKSDLSLVQRTNVFRHQIALPLDILNTWLKFQHVLSFFVHLRLAERGIPCLGGDYVLL